MDTNEFKGATNGTIGKVQDAIGSFTDNASTQLAGKAKELGGKAQQLYGQGADQVRQTTTENPVVTVAVVGLAGFLLGALFTSSGRHSTGYDYGPSRGARRY